MSTHRHFCPDSLAGVDASESWSRREVEPDLFPLLLAATACIDAPVWQFQWRVVDCSSGRQLEGVKVILLVKDKDRELQAESVTDRSGAFSLNLIPQHQRPATLRFWMPGFNARAVRLRNVQDLRAQPQQVCLVPTQPER